MVTIPGGRVERGAAMEQSVSALDAPRLVYSKKLTSGAGVRQGVVGVRVSLAKGGRRRERVKKHVEETCTGSRA